MSSADSIETRPSASARLRGSLGERGAAFALALAVELGLALLLWFIAPALTEKEPPQTTTVFGVDATPGETEQAQSTERENAETKRDGRATPRKAQPRPVEPPPLSPPAPPTEPLPETFIRMTRREYRAADITGKGITPRPPAEREVVASAPPESQQGDSEIVGKAPNGEPLYAADWYRPPTRAEMQPYISPRATGREGWGRIICRHVTDRRLEDCQELDESPRGSGYAGTVRQAAFQYRMRAPRAGGREVLGGWIRITGYFVAGKDVR